MNIRTSWGSGRNKSRWRLFRDDKHISNAEGRGELERVERPKLTRDHSSIARQISINQKQIINIFQSRRAEKKYLAPSDS